MILVYLQVYQEDFGITLSSFCLLKKGGPGIYPSLLSIVECLGALRYFQLLIRPPLLRKTHWILMANLLVGYGTEKVQAFQDDFSLIIPYKK